jgi:hypothetical protein
MYSKPKKEAGMWLTRLLSSGPLGVVQFKSLSRKTVADWIAANTAPPPASYRMNASTGASVWRERDSNASQK